MRKYSDKEVGQILGKAAALQSGSAEFSTPEGTTLSELQRVADEVGIDPKMIERAAAELDTLRRTTASKRSNTVLLEQTVAGEVSEEIWEDLVTTLRTETGSAGKSEIGPRKREWIGGGDTQSMVLTVTTRQGRTQIKLLGDCAGAAVLAGTLGFASGIFLTLAPVIVNTKTGLLGPLLTFLLAILVVASVVLATIATIYSRRSTFCSHLNSVLDRLVDVAESEQVSLRDREVTPLLGLAPNEIVEAPSITTLG